MKPNPRGGPLSAGVRRSSSAGGEGQACSGRIETPPRASAGARPALGRCRMVSIRTDELAGARRRRYSTGGTSRWSSRPSGDEGARSDVSRPLHAHAEGWLALSRAGWSRYAGTSQARPCYSTSGTFRWSSSRRRDEGADGDVSRPFQAVAGGWPALGRCRVVSIRRGYAPRATAPSHPRRSFRPRKREVPPARGRYSTSGGGRTSDARSGWRRSVGTRGRASRGRTATSPNAHP